MLLFKEVGKQSKSTTPRRSNCHKLLNCKCTENRTENFLLTEYPKWQICEVGKWQAKVPSFGGGLVGDRALTSRYSRCTSCTTITRHLKVGTLLRRTRFRFLTRHKRYHTKLPPSLTPRNISFKICFFTCTDKGETPSAKAWIEASQQLMSPSWHFKITKQLLLKITRHPHPIPRYRPLSLYQCLSFHHTTLSWFHCISPSLSLPLCLSWSSHVHDSIFFHANIAGSCTRYWTNIRTWIIWEIATLNDYKQEGTPTYSLLSEHLNPRIKSHPCRQYIPQSDWCMALAGGVSPFRLRAMLRICFPGTPTKQLQQPKPEHQKSTLNDNTQFRHTYIFIYIFYEATARVPSHCFQSGLPSPAAMWKEARRRIINLRLARHPPCQNFHELCTR